MPKEKTAEELAVLRGDVVDENNPPGELVGDDDEEEEVAEVDGADDISAEEDDSEEAEEPEEAEEEEEEPEEPGDDADDERPAITIPKARFDESQRKARAREDALNLRIKQMEEKLQTDTTEDNVKELSDDVESLTVKYEDLLLDGELEKARAVRHERDVKQNELFDSRLAQQGQVTGAAAVDQMRFDAQLAQFEAKYPAINPDSNDFNQNLADEVAEMLAVYKASGFTAAAALNKAVHYVVPNDNEPIAGEDPNIVRSRRGQQARKRVAKTVKKAPPDISKTGRDSDKLGTGDGLPDITKMSPEQFDKLSESDLKKMRHDSLSDEEAA